ncbi:hypothetical protein [Capnocytophaga gingivalis]|uniref:Uncharacterized protein n=1 Tax=Capnocytophaga gingivalis TaxID=1017 RepID=A0ABU5Z948_9FLAO|nr:hypothetical protein [Capnocytophaga gingivalis]MEB3075500.1 hypothetical protein [Capnocytophaga gingivalis]
MQHTIDIDPVTLEKTQNYTKEKREKGDFDKALDALIGVLSEEDFEKKDTDKEDFTDVILEKYYSLG